jgi:sugar O-acyltransferase (sialic acid O-acetyltransferase NeuD family)
MIVAGAGGFAKQALSVFAQLELSEDLYFFDNQRSDLPDYFIEKFKLITTTEEAALILQQHPNFTLGVGNPQARKTLNDLFISLGGVPYSLISPKAVIAPYDVTIGKSVSFMTGAVVEVSCTIGNGVLLNVNCAITHDSSIGDYTEIMPGVHLSGGVKIGNFCRIGTGSVVLPGVTIGNNVIIGAGAVVTKNIPDNCTAVGVPAKIIK